MKDFARGGWWLSLCLWRSLTKAFGVQARRWPLRWRRWLSVAGPPGPSLGSSLFRLLLCSVAHFSEATPPPKKKDSAIPSLWGARVELDVGVARSGSIFYMHPWPPVLGSLQNRFHFPIRLGSCPPAVPLTTQKWGRQRKWNHCTPRLPKQEVTP